MASQEYRIHFPHCVIVRAPGLLPMMYKPHELADELGVPARTLYDWLHAGAPHQRDRSDHIWVNGELFSAWIEENRKKKTSGQKLGPDEGYCLRCKAPVPLINPTRKHQRGRLYLITGVCPKCGITISRGDAE